MIRTKMQLINAIAAAIGLLALTHNADACGRVGRFGGGYCGGVPAAAVYPAPVAGGYVVDGGYVNAYPYAVGGVLPLSYYGGYGGYWRRRGGHHHHHHHHGKGGHGHGHGHGFKKRDVDNVEDVEDVEESADEDKQLYARHDPHDWRRRRHWRRRYYPYRYHSHDHHHHRHHKRDADEEYEMLNEEEDAPYDVNTEVDQEDMDKEQQADVNVLQEKQRMTQPN